MTDIAMFLNILYTCGEKSTNLGKVKLSPNLSGFRLRLQDQEAYDGIRCFEREGF